LFYVDDLGYGDVGVYGAKGVKTPHLDALAKNGVMFTDAHCAAATCTPSRYSLLTGNYAFRRKAAVLKGDAPLLIDTASQTLPKVFQAAGYKTAVVGKWHLGLGYGDIDWNKHITPGPNEVGFDYSFLLPATGDRVPTVFVENGWVVNADPNDPIKVSYNKRIDERPLGNERPDLLKQIADPQHSNTIVNGMSRIGYMTGGKSALWVDEDFPFIFTDKSKQFINESKDQPFFLFYSFHDIHVPRMPHDSFKDKSEMGPRGDAIVQVDWVVGQMVDELEKLGLIENTIIIFTSDNGPVLDDGYADQSEELLGAHQPGGIYRGGKYSAFEAGTRVPTIVSWKGEVAPKESNALVTQVDLLASMAKLVEQTVTQEVIDSEDQLAAWLGRSDQGREVMLEEAYTLAIRKGPWKYIRPVGYPTPQWLINKKVDAGLSQEDALYNLDNDPSEEINAAQSEAEIVKEMSEMLQQIVDKTTR
ncbi:MAG: arylsulfatase, partial [Bacteroidota bacterium]